MDVLLKKDIHGLGLAGDVKSVANGYARNSLIPQGLAIPANKGTAKQAKQIQESAARRRDRERLVAMSLAEKLQTVTLNFKARAAASDRLFGSITASDIALAVEQATGEELDKRLIALDRPIRDLGSHAVPVRPMADGVPEITGIVELGGGIMGAGAIEEVEEEEAA